MAAPDRGRGLEARPDQHPPRERREHPGTPGNTREVKLHPEARLELSAYLDLRRDLEFHDPALWVTEYGVPIGYAGLGRDMKRLAEKAGLDLRDVFHIFRRTVARNAKRQNIDTQHILGESWMEG